MRKPSIRSLALLGLCMALGACGDGDDAPAASAQPAPNGEASPGLAPSGGTDVAAPAGTAAPSARWLVHSAVTGADRSRLNYFSVVDGLGNARRLTYERSVELSGRPRLYVERGIGIFALGEAESLSITRYELGSDDTLKPGARLSLQPFGVNALEPQGVHFVSATKAYYKDSDQLQVLVFNPTTMTVERVIPLPRALLVAGHETQFSRWATRAGEAFFAVSTTDKDFTRALPGTTLVRLDTQTDALTTVAEPRCRGINRIGKVGETLYFFSDVINGFGHAVYPNDGGQPDCILRIAPGQQNFDPSYLGSMAPALGGKIATILAVTESGEAWLQAIDPAVMPTAKGTTYTEWYKNGWHWMHIPLATLTNPVDVGLPKGAYSAQTVIDGSRFFISQSTPDYAQTTLVDLSSGTPQPGISFSGLVLDVERIR